MLIAICSSLGYFFMAREAARAIPYGGAIINSGSVTGIEGSKNLLDYRRISLFTSLPELFEYFRFLAFLAMIVRQIACEKIICVEIVGSLSGFWS
jgi:hypothetical protein